ncbi:hypothetical protein ACWEPH_18485 [Nocardia beijingensis]
MVAATELDSREVHPTSRQIERDLGGGHRIRYRAPESFRPEVQPVELAGCNPAHGHRRGLFPFSQERRVQVHVEDVSASRREVIAGRTHVQGLTQVILSGVQAVRTDEQPLGIHRERDDCGLRVVVGDGVVGDEFLVLGFARRNHGSR